MKKLVILLLMISITLSGCTFFGGKRVPPSGTSDGAGKKGAQQEKPKPGEPKREKKAYYVGLQAPVPGIKDWVARYRQYDGVFLQKIGDYRVLLVGMGEMFSAGYEVKIERVSKKEDKWVVEMAFYLPKSEDYSGASTYPYQVVSIVDDGKPVEVLAATAQNGILPAKKAVKVITIPEGKQLAASKNFVVFTPLEGAIITSPVTIEGKARVFEATFRIGIEDGHYQLANKVVMSDQGAPGWGYFKVELPFNRPTNPHGMIILSYENMKDGSMVEELMLPVKFK